MRLSSMVNTENNKARAATPEVYFYILEYKCVMTHLCVGTLV
ncbi:MAG: hypothetical protein UZ01_00866 [Candidatus Brocadia sinica]|nr:MAG: hypothetical protein UZ01_00866 [Candidatus Brocadia sinica]